MRPRSVRGRVTVRVPGGPARQPCVLYSETGSSAQAGIKLYGSIGLRSDFTAPVSAKTYKRGEAGDVRVAWPCAHIAGAVRPFQGSMSEPGPSCIKQYLALDGTCCYSPPMFMARRIADRCRT
ncbi:hypothetical protein DM50_2950 [Burkholderia mallei]|nr:hypothetical protein DM75_2115 [Burkholderia mallei]KOS75511.1 hypothetical protein DM46_1628 [Burkholderia mallei]KOS97873.1 hypothetical protein DM50_2950 [Burkholderia mallei]